MVWLGWLDVRLELSLVEDAMLRRKLLPEPGPWLIKELVQTGARPVIEDLVAIKNLQSSGVQNKEEMQKMLLLLLLLMFRKYLAKAGNRRCALPIIGQNAFQKDLCPVHQFSAILLAIPISGQTTHAVLQLRMSNSFFKSILLESYASNIVDIKSYLNYTSTKPFTCTTFLQSNPFQSSTTQHKEKTARMIASTPNPSP